MAIQHETTAKQVTATKKFLPALISNLGLAVLSATIASYCLYLTTGTLVWFVYLALGASVLMAFVLTWLQGRMWWHKLRFPFLSFLLAIALTIGSAKVLQLFEEQDRIHMAMVEMPIFPGAELQKATYQPGDRIENEPKVIVEFTLPKAQERYCEIAAYYDTELQKSGWAKTPYLPGFNPLEYSPVPCSASDTYYKDLPSRSIWVHHASAELLESVDTFNIIMRF